MYFGSRVDKSCQYLVNHVIATQQKKARGMGLSGRATIYLNVVKWALKETIYNQLGYGSDTKRPH